LLDEFQADAIHLSTEGPLGIAARRYCLRRGRPFTTAFHTRFPEYVHARFGLSTRVTYGLVRRFHRPASHTMVATTSLAEELARRGFRNLTRWSRGVDTELFKPRDRNFLDLPRPISLYVGRVAVEKNIEAFLQLSLPGTKVVVGDGPQRTQLEREYPQAVFVGMKQGEALARHYAAADVFVFPSLTDTFGLVILEALACGVPVAAFPVTGPRDVIGDARVGCLDDDLQRAVTRALALDRQACRAFALNFSWAHSIRQFRSHLVVFPSSPSPDLTITSPGNPPPVPSAGDAPHI
jgi:glycosyltransferase involved in cell wall biosynthesis